MKNKKDENMSDEEEDVKLNLPKDEDDFMSGSPRDSENSEKISKKSDSLDENLKKPLIIEKKEKKHSLFF